MVTSESHVEDSHSQQSNQEQNLERSSPEQDSTEEASSEHDSPQLAEEDTWVWILAAQLTRVMQGEEEEDEIIAFLQRENDFLRTQLVQSSCGRHPSHDAGGDLHTYWLRQHARLEHIKALHERIRTHRAEIRRMLGLLGSSEDDNPQRQSGDGL